MIGANAVTFRYDAGADSLFGQIVNANGTFSATYPSFTAKAAQFKGTAVTPADLNHLQTATPDAGSLFAGWSGSGCTGTAPTIEVTRPASSELTCVATFDRGSPDVKAIPILPPWLLALLGTLMAGLGVRGLRRRRLSA